jgi:hypothetical protein
MADPITGLVGAGLGIVGAVGNMFSTRKANKELKKLEKQNPTYAANPLAQERLNLAKSMLNARMPGASYLEQNIFSNQGNQMQNINTNATDSSQALALAAGSQGQTNEALAKLGFTETQDFQRRYQNFTGAQDTQINEMDKVFSDRVRGFEDKVRFAGARAANNSNAWNSISSIGQGVMNMGLAGGGWGALAGGQGGGQGSVPGMQSVGNVTSSLRDMSPVVGGNAPGQAQTMQALSGYFKRPI